MRTGVSSNLTEGAARPDTVRPDHGGAGPASEPRLEIAGAVTRRGFKALPLRHARLAQRNERPAHTGEDRGSTPRLGTVVVAQW